MEQIICNWYETNIAQFLMKYNLPVRHETNSICDFIKQYSDQYLKDFDKILLNGPFRNYDIELYDLFREQKPFVKDLFEKIKASGFSLSQCSINCIGERLSAKDRFIGQQMWYNPNRSKRKTKKPPKGLSGTQCAVGQADDLDESLFELVA